ncbi:hypothetical protein [Saccharopolyspora pogona]|uniref:hypothetical protein n=1 Tax=Saccharopolyspora pogona TaxID=333966 RepID=UPI001CC249C2|nr:hypothetical protein [Saccharopolyspora pogona]
MATCRAARGNELTHAHVDPRTETRAGIYRMRGMMTVDLGRAQRTHWQSTHRAHPHMYGDEPSEPAQHAAGAFSAGHATSVLEPGAGHGRDSVHFARRGFTVHATDFSRDGLTEVHAFEEGGLPRRLWRITRTKPR